MRKILTILFVGLSVVSCSRSSPVGTTIDITEKLKQENRAMIEDADLPTFFPDVALIRNRGDLVSDQHVQEIFTEHIKLPGITGYAQQWNIGGDRYAAGPVHESISDYIFLKNDRQIFEASMCYGAEPPVREVQLVLGKPAFTYDTGPCVETPENNGIKTPGNDIFYDGQSMNVRFDLDSSHHLFVWNSHLGFVGKKNGQEFIMLDGKPVSEGFGEIATHSCCMPDVLPFLQVYENGTVIFIGKRDGRIFLSAVDLASTTSPPPTSATGSSISRPSQDSSR